MLNLLPSAFLNIFEIKETTEIPSPIALLGALFPESQIFLVYFDTSGIPTMVIHPPFP
jgi:hypothetical protein